MSPNQTFLETKVEESQFLKETLFWMANIFFVYPGFELAKLQGVIFSRRQKLLKLKILNFRA